MIGFAKKHTASSGWGATEYPIAVGHERTLLFPWSDGSRLTLFRDFRSCRRSSQGWQGREAYQGWRHRWSRRTVLQLWQVSLLLEQRDPVLLKGGTFFLID
jgi:hypothetical protein